MFPVAQKRSQNILKSPQSHDASPQRHDLLVQIFLRRRSPQRHDLVAGPPGVSPHNVMIDPNPLRVALVRQAVSTLSKWRAVRQVVAWKVAAGQSLRDQARMRAPGRASRFSRHAKMPQIRVLPPAPIKTGAAAPSSLYAVNRIGLHGVASENGFQSTVTIAAPAECVFQRSWTPISV